MLWAQHSHEIAVQMLVSLCTLQGDDRGVMEWSLHLPSAALATWMRRRGRGEGRLPRHGNAPNPRDWEASFLDPSAHTALSCVW